MRTRIEKAVTKGLKPQYAAHYNRGLFWRRIELDVSASGTSVYHTFDLAVAEKAIDKLLASAPEREVTYLQYPKGPRDD